MNSSSGSSGGNGVSFKRTTANKQKQLGRQTTAGAYQFNVPHHPEPTLYHHGVVEEGDRHDVAVQLISQVGIVVLLLRMILFPSELRVVARLAPLAFSVSTLSLAGPPC